jgi:hypothetical protein
MIPLSEIFGIMAAACLVPPLYYGTVQDLREFRFSKTHFESLWVNAAYVLVILMYLEILLEGSWIFACELLAISVVSSLIFSFIGFRYSSGGDWRALIYVAWIAPLMLVSVLLASGICGILQAMYWVWRTDIDVPPMFRKIPFALSIFCGYLIALSYMIVTGLLS